MGATLRQSLRNILRLCGKEITSLRRDHVLFAFMLYAFTFMVYAEATSSSHDLVHASLGVVDEDRSALSRRIVDAFLPPRFQPPVAVAPHEVDRAMDRARFTFVLDIPPDFQADLLAGRRPSVQLLIDATAVMQAGIGANYIQSIIGDEISRYLRHGTDADADAVDLKLRIAFNQTMESVWFTGTMGMVEVITMLSILLAGAALMREREHGTLEHLLVMPVRPVEIMLAKIIANGGIITIMTLLCLYGIQEWILGLQVAGSTPLFMLATAIYVFFAASLGIFLATLTGSMAQFALLFILVQMPLRLLSGAFSPLEGMPQWLQYAVQALPSKHYVALTQAILSRGAGIGTVWPEFLVILAMGAAFFGFSLARFRSFLARQQ